MKEVKNSIVLQNYMEQYQIKDYFNTPGLHFQLIQYHKGDMVIRPEEPMNSIIFVVKGGVKIYAIRMDGTQNAINMTNGFIILGEMEFLTDSPPLFFAEAVSDLICIAVSIHRHKDQLLDDARFLRLLARVLAQKFQMITQQETISMSLEEKLLNHMKYHCYNQIVVHMEQTAFQLHCSRRQLQRVLKKLIENHKVIKIGKGKYQLAKLESAKN